MGEPKFGIKEVRLTGKPGKIKAFFNLIIPTETLGNIELSGFKVVEGKKGLFVSLPNRAVPGKTEQKVDTATGLTTTVTSEPKYYNNLRFDSQDRYNEFRKELNESVLPMIAGRLAK